MIIGTNIAVVPPCLKHTLPLFLRTVIRTAQNNGSAPSKPTSEKTVSVRPRKSIRKEAPAAITPPAALLEAHKPCYFSFSSVYTY